MLSLPFQSFFAFVERIGATPGESAERRLQRSLLVGAILCGVPSLAFWGTLYLLAGEPVAGGLMYAFSLVDLVCLIVFARTRRGFFLFAVSVLALVLLFSFAMVLVLGGLSHSYGQALWALLTPVGALFLFPRYAKRWFAAYLAYLVVSLVVEFYLPTPARLSPTLERIYFGLNLAFVSSFVFFLMFFFVNQRDTAYRLLRVEQEKGEALLLNILPHEIADILKNNGRTIADHFDGASILFADIVNFTPLSTSMSPVELVELLNEVFSHFDTLVEKHDLEKIKTIGDAYMVAAGVPHPCATHAQALAEMALEMQAYMAQHTFRGGHKLSLRIGINSGPVVAGVIGRKKFIYDLWGDAVNTASRMESHSASGQTQITRSTYELIKDEFLCEPRGTVVVKGKGEMEVWYLLGKKEQVPAVAPALLAEPPRVEDAGRDTLQHHG